MHTKHCAFAIVATATVVAALRLTDIWAFKWCSCLAAQNTRHPPNYYKKLHRKHALCRFFQEVIHPDATKN